MTREEMLEHVSAMLDRLTVPDAVVSLSEQRDSFVRFGQNRITQNMDTFKRVLTLHVGDGERQAAYRTRRVDPGSFDETAGKAIDLLESASPDPEYVPVVPGGQVYPIVRDWDEATAEAGPDGRTGAAGAAIGKARGEGMEASGITGSTWSKEALGTSSGNLAFHRSTRAYFNLTMDRSDGSSYRALSSTDWAGLPVDETVDAVAEETARAEGAVDLEPGEYRLLLEPQAVADLYPYIAWSLDARQADEGLTVFSERAGERVMSPELNMSSVVDGAVKGVPFNDEGLAARDVTWVDSGVLTNQPCDRWWASDTGREPLFIPGTLCIEVEGGSGGIPDLAAGVEGRALLFRRFWYIRFVDQKELSLTGMTRDGVFLVEDGRVKGPVRDFRWNWKPLDLFSRIEAAGEPVRKGQLLVPPMLVGPTPLS